MLRLDLSMVAVCPRSKNGSSSCVDIEKLFCEQVLMCGRS